ncbi:MAG: hypothetical protein HOA57_01615 [Candidatus Magasanikbacteria bacterium]|jgi:hypothetical protein|nr:hypothetical protein [Candidatus Magasanikbacteria bacterium]MBT4315199.1 hypothetical protein [Candidatus Magasanikbacteria bacterium]MBT4547344.1 hypothetical protein [Candidatus Magasanikbacteria bacterium]MBT6819054.1 hypothetical protein [Candidatus Magasanikbacteria bacterium]
MSLEAEKKIYSNEQEKSHESRESKESEVDAELKSASAMEKADFLVKEVKSSKKQMQNIVLHMQEVTQAIRNLRAQLQLVQDDDDPTSIRQDKKKVEELKLKIKDYVVEVEKMREDLIREEMAELEKGVAINMSEEDLRTKAEESIEKMIKSIKE